MYLYEFTSDYLAANIITAIDNLKQKIHNGEVTKNFTMDELLDYFENFGIELNPNDIYTMSEVPPLKSLVHPISGKEIRFKGLPQDPTPAESPPPEMSKQVVARMAKKAQR